MQPIIVKREGDSAIIFDEFGVAFIELEPTRNSETRIVEDALAALSRHGHQNAANQLAQVVRDIRNTPGAMPMTAVVAKDRAGRRVRITTERDIHHSYISGRLHRLVRFVDDHQGRRWLMKGAQTLYGRDKAGWFRVSEPMTAPADVRRLPA